MGGDRNPKVGEGKGQVEGGYENRCLNQMSTLCAHVSLQGSTLALHIFPGGNYNGGKRPMTK